jgi:hypothetical protein
MEYMEYTKFFINDKVTIKKEVINNFLLSNVVKQENVEVVKYVLSNKNYLTIKKIDIQPLLIVRAVLYFSECYGNLYDDQVFKLLNFPIITINRGDFK